MAKQENCSDHSLLSEPGGPHQKKNNKETVCPMGQFTAAVFGQGMIGGNGWRQSINRDIPYGIFHLVVLIPKDHA
jgi:hypothetical protein